jgi:hypothetical protein
MGIGATVEFPAVKVVRESDLRLCCRITGRNHWIARDRVLSRSSVVHFGHRGTPSSWRGSLLKTGRLLLGGLRAPQ